MKEWIKKYQYMGIVVGILLLFFLSFLMPKKVDKVEDVALVKKEKKKEVAITKEIIIDIKGSVLNPGVYKMKMGTTVNDAIQASGGLSANADTSYINLSKRLNDETVIIIYTKEEIDQLKVGDSRGTIIEKECICPKLENNACVDSKKTITNQLEQAPTGLISINRATVEELDSLPGIGPAKAKDIIQYRTTNGGFQTIEDLKQVKGIGDAVFSKIAPLIEL